MSVDDRSHNPRLTEDVAHRLLARAVELDVTRTQELSLDQLREAAREAGISAAAFDAAYAELQEAVDRSESRAMGHAQRLWRRVRAWSGRPAGGLGDTLARNGVALVASYGILVTLVMIARGAGVEWLARKAVDPVALALGAALAVRLRARPAAILIAGLAIAVGAEFLMDAVFGAPAVKGLGSHWALLVSGVAGVVIGARLVRRPSNDDRAAEHLAASTSASQPDTPRPLQHDRSALLRLRPARA